LALSVFAYVLGGDVIELTDDDFEATIAANKYVLVKFFAPWCGHCKSLAPEYEAAATVLKGQEIEGGLALTEVDATVHKKYAGEHDVRGFPTLKWFVNGQVSDYGGGRTKDEIVAWISKKTGPPAVTVTDLENFKSTADAVVFGQFSDLESAAAKAYLDAAAEDDSATYGISSTIKADGVADNSVVVFRNFPGEEPQLILSSFSTAAEVRQHVSGAILPLVIPFSQENAPKIFGGSIKQHVLTFKSTSDDTTTGLIRSAAKEYQGEYLFVTISEEDDKIMEFFGVAESDFPTARIITMGDGPMKKFKMETALTEASIKEFVASHKAGTLAVDLKSAPAIPDEDQKDNAVFVLTGKSHDDKVKNSGKAVFVKYYAPWCGHCKKMAPDYEKIGEHYKGNDKILIAEMDSTENEVSSVEVQGFPTLKLWLNGEPVDFEGDRTFDGIKSFIDSKV
jgi:protein disulfide-isomerase A1